MPAMSGRKLPAGETSITAQFPKPEAERLPRPLKARHLPAVYRERNGVLPGHVTPVAVLDHHGRIGEDLGTEEYIIVPEAQDPHPGRVDKPEVVARQVKIFGLLSGQVADVLAGSHVDPSEIQSEPGVVAAGLAHDAYPHHPLAQSGAPPHHRGPFLVPRIVRLAGQKPAHLLGLLGLVVPLPGLQAESGVLIAEDEVSERLTTKKLSHSPSCAKRSSPLGIST